MRKLLLFSFRCTYFQPVFSRSEALLISGPAKPADLLISSCRLPTSRTGIRYPRKAIRTVGDLLSWTLHSEWFEGDKDPGIRVMEKWARWMNADTYEVVGQLNTFWVQILCELEEEHLSPTCSNIVEAPERQQAQEHSLKTCFPN